MDILQKKEWKSVVIQCITSIIICNTLYYILKIKIMSIISFRIDEELKNKFYKITSDMWIDSSTALRFFINKVVEDPDTIKFDLKKEKKKKNKKKCKK